MHTSVPGDVSLHFTVGPLQIVQADVDNHRLVVIRDGKVIMDSRLTTGWEPTRSGHPQRHPRGDEQEPALPHIKSRLRVCQLSLALVGADSNNGEFIHANPETTAKGYFDSALFVDPVEVSGSGWRCRLRTATFTTGPCPGTSGPRCPRCSDRTSPPERLRDRTER